MNILALPGKVAFEIMRAVVLFFYHLSGWKIEGSVPPTNKFLVIAAPHTTNWDLPMMLLLALHFRVRLHWAGKASLFKPPFGWLMTALGGVPIDRSKSDNFVDQIVERYQSRDSFVIGILPEGTRAKVSEWKSGFYHIAMGADVPIAFGFVDYGRKVGGIGDVMTASGDYDGDLERIKAFYANVTPKYPDRAGLCD